MRWRRACYRRYRSDSERSWSPHSPPRAFREQPMDMGLDLLLKGHPEVYVTALDEFLPGGKKRARTIRRFDLAAAMTTPVRAAVPSFRWVPNPRPTTFGQVCVGVAVAQDGTVNQIWMGQLTATIV